MKNNQTKTIRFILICVLCFMSNNISAQNIGTLFVKMPQHYIPTLTEKQRFELLEYAKAKMNDSVKNQFENYATVQLYDSANQHIVIRPTKNSIVDLRLFKLSDNKCLVGVIHTITSPISYSSIKFYNCQWKDTPLRFPVPKASQWLNKELLKDNINTERINKALENSFISLAFSNTGTQIEATNNTLEFLSIEDKRIASPLLKTQKLIFTLQNNEWIMTPAP